MKKKKPYYLRSVNEVLESFNTNEKDGLSEEEVKKRQTQYGKNILGEKKKTSLFKVLINQFKSFVMLLLLAAAVASFLINEVVEGVAVLVVILITAIVGLIMEYKAGKSIEALQETVKDEANVLRDGKIVKVTTENVVVGDIVILDEGDKVPADGRVIDSQNLAVDESMLTGESDSVSKTSQKLDEESTLAERHNMVFMGSNVVKGDAKMVVTAIALDTEMGNISTMLSETSDEDTPLEKRLEQTGRFLIVLTLVISVIVAVVGYLSGNDLESMVKTAIALAIAAVPEGLPAAATITLAIGMKRMAKKKALLRNLPAVETLGSATVFCTDKTGTLTENEMTLKKLVSLDKDIEIEGTGYEPTGEFIEKENKIDPTTDDFVLKMLKIGFYCNGATLQEEDGVHKVIGDPTEGALLVATKKAGLEFEDLLESYEEIEVLPFDSIRKFMAVHYKDKDDNHFIAVKGAPNVMIDQCTHIENKNGKRSLKNKQKKTLKKLNQSLAKERYRVLGFAYKKLNDEETKPLEEALKSGLIFVGFTGMLDPARSGIKASIQEAKDAGIRTIMLTGDQQETALGIAKTVGLEWNEEMLLNDQSIGSLSKKKLKTTLKENSIFSRVTPEDKLKIVEALKESDEVVAMTGDGVNDAPALKKADIGIAMGKRGTSVAKEASDMILLDDRYQTIVEAVKQGRVIFDNIQKFIHYLLSCNLSEIIFIFLALLLGLPLPLIALQILWLNVATGVFPALSMAWEIPESRVMEKPPREPGSPIITNHYKKLIGLQGLLIALGPLLSYVIVLNQGATTNVARTVGFMTLAMVHLLQVFNVRKRNGLGFERSLFKNKYMIGAIILTFILQLIAIYVGPLQRVLDTTALTLDLWVYVIMGAIVPIILLQLIALIKERRNQHAMDKE